MTEMKYYDPIYARHCNGGWELPPILEKLSHTVEAVRARQITQAVKPNHLNFYGAIPSRFQHGMGVAFLTQIMLRKNPLLADQSDLFLAAAMMHDWGLPGLSHLPEYFLKKVTGMNGESFLAYILENCCDAISVLRDFDVDYHDVVKLVTGDFGPVGAVLKGSMDLDNLDNVLRYALSCHFLGRKPNVIEIAASLRFNSEFWTLSDNCLNSVRRWQKCREKVYGELYKQPNLSPSMMIFRAIDLAYRRGLIDVYFFLMNDEDAINYLLESDECSAVLMQRVISWNWYDEVYSIETSFGSSIIGDLAKDSGNRGRIANIICNELKLELEDVCVYVGKGNEKRRVAIPFVSADGDKIYLDETDDRPIYRFKVFVNPDLSAIKIHLVCSLARRIAFGEEVIV